MSNDIVIPENRSEGSTLCLLKELPVWAVRREDVSNVTMKVILLKSVLRRRPLGRTETIQMMLTFRETATVVDVVDIRRWTVDQIEEEMWNVVEDTTRHSDLAVTVPVIDLVVPIDQIDQ